MNNFQIIDILNDELQRMHAENLIHILRHKEFNYPELRSNRYKYTQENQGLERPRTGKIHIFLDDISFSVVHYFKINNYYFYFEFPLSDAFVLLHLRETFRPWVLLALTMPIHERVANFEAYLQQRKIDIASSRLLARSRLPGMPDDLGEKISSYIR